MARDVFVYTVAFEKSDGARKVCGPYKTVTEANDIAQGQIRKGSHNVRIVVEEYVNSDYAMSGRKCA